MSMIAAPKVHKADSNQLIKSVMPLSDSPSAEGSLLEEFSQILDKIADQLARGHQGAETVDLLAIEQAAERVQSQVGPVAQRFATPSASEQDELDVTTAKDQEGDSGAHRNVGEDVLDEGGVDIERAMNTASSKGGETELRLVEEGVAKEVSEDPTPTTMLTDTEPKPGSSNRGSDNTLSSMVEETLAEEISPSGGEKVDAESAAVTAPPQHAATARVRSGESNRATIEAMSSVEQASRLDRPSTDMAGTSETAVTSLGRTMEGVAVRSEFISTTENSKQLTGEKAVPFSTFMLQGNGFAGSGLSRDVVAQAILKPGLESSISRQVNEVTASGKGGLQGGMGGSNGDASILRGPASQVANDSSARAMKSLPRAIAARTLEKVERALEEIARSKDGKTISLHLEPVTLGKVKVDVSLREGNLHARLSAEAYEVQHLLREHAHELQAILRKIGLHVDSVSVSVSSDDGTFESATDLFGRENSSERSERDAEADTFSTSPEVGENRRTPVADDHWVA